MPVCNQVLVPADDMRGLKPSRPMKRMKQPRKIALAGPRSAGIYGKIEAGPERRKLGPIFSRKSEIAALMVHRLPCG